VIERDHLSITEAGVAVEQHDGRGQAGDDDEAVDDQHRPLWPGVRHLAGWFVRRGGRVGHGGETLPGGAAL
jgi:hypothetical protein